MDNLTPAQRRRNMQNIRSTGTKPEVFIAKSLKLKKIYFSQNVKTIFGKPDFVFRKKRVIVFVDSDFWHGHPKRCRMPKSNKKYWNNKIKSNKERDRKVNKRLREQRWVVIRLWEHDIKTNLDGCIIKILKALSSSTNN